MTRCVKRSKDGHGDGTRWMTSISLLRRSGVIVLMRTLSTGSRVAVSRVERPGDPSSHRRLR